MKVNARTFDVLWFFAFYVAVWLAITFAVGFLGLALYSDWQLYMMPLCPLAAPSPLVML